MPSTTGSHPWADHLNTRRDFKITANFEENDQNPAPHKFNDRNLIRGPDDYRVITVREYITLDDVIVYRDETTRLSNSKKKNNDLALALGSLSLNEEKKNFRVIYRYTDVIKNGSLAILEAIHFEIFMPDRPDLRFIAIPIGLFPRDSCEGDYFEIYEVTHTPNLCTMTVGSNYSLAWTVTKLCRMERHGTPTVDYIYIAEKEKSSQDRKAVCNWTTTFIQPKHARFNQTAEEKCMEVHRIYDANLVDTSSAWIYPVEPPKNREEYSKLVQNVKSTSHFAGTFAQEIFPLSPTENDRIKDRLGDFNEFSSDMQMAENHMLRLFKLGVRFRQLITPPQKENVFVQSFDPPRLQVYTEVFYLDAVTLHFEEFDFKLIVENIKRETFGKRKNTYITCVRFPDFVQTMGSRCPNFWIDATFHGDGGSATEKVLEKIDNQIAKVEITGEVKQSFLIDEEVPKMIQSMYGQNMKKDKYLTTGCYKVKRSNGQEMKLNAQQTRAMTIYHRIENSGYCILSPPGSGKTTVAAAMAASLVKDKEANRQGKVQMLLAVQNVAVENLAIALKAFDDGTLRSYRLLSRLRVDENDPTPYDIFEHFPDYMRWMKNATKEELKKMNKYFKIEAEWKNSKMNGNRLSKTEQDELNLLYHQTMFSAKSTLEKYMQPEIILATVDLALFKLLDVAERGVRGQFWDVDRVIIDEASLLTESTFYCLVRCFPKASFVLIGDDKQLPPFMYDKTILGHEIAGRAALNVAMRRKNIPIIQLVEVYRAPQELVQPYNNLSYDGTLVSRKKEPCRPLLQAGLVAKTRPDLLLVDIPKGHQRGLNSPYNELEIDVLERLLRIFPQKMHDDIMIICLYKEQKKRVQRRLGPDYEIMTVDSSQGKEKSIVIVMTTRTEKVTDFFCNQNRCTVAVSRQQRALIILGNSSLLSHKLPWSKVLEDFTTIEPPQIPGPKWDPNPKKWNQKSFAVKKGMQPRENLGSLRKSRGEAPQFVKDIIKKSRARNAENNIKKQPSKPDKFVKVLRQVPKGKMSTGQVNQKPSSAPSVVVKPMQGVVANQVVKPLKEDHQKKEVAVKKAVAVVNPPGVESAGNEEIKKRKKQTSKQRNDLRKRARARARAAEALVVAQASIVQK